MKRCTTSSGHIRGRQQPDLLLLTHRATLGSAPFKHDSLGITNFFNKYRTTPQIFQVLRSSIALATISVSLNLITNAHANQGVNHRNKFKDLSVSHLLTVATQ